MPRALRRQLWGGLLFVAFGLCTEIVFSGVLAGWAGAFEGEVSLLMVPVYALAWLVLGPLLAALARAGIDRPAVRLPLLVAGIYAVEWTFGAAYASVGLHPWHYDHGWASAWSGGHVTLLYLPAWCVFAVLLPPVHRTLRRVAPHLDDAVQQGRGGTAPTDDAPPSPGRGAATRGAPGP